MQFFAKLPSILTKIEADNNHDQLTPIFQQHKKHLTDFGQPIKEITQEQQQRKVFQESRHHYNKEENRKIYMGSILNNLGLGSGLSSRTSEQVRKCTDHHNKKIMKHKQHREQIINGQTTAQLLNQVQESLLERQKEQTMRLVERQGKVGEGLLRLKIERLQNEKALEETIEFNERMSSPEKWNQQLRLRQKKELAEFQTKRDAEKVKMIMEVCQTPDQAQSLSAAKHKNSQMFTADRKVASDIFIESDQLIMSNVTCQPPPECPDSINQFTQIEIEPKFQTIMDEIKGYDQLLDKKNRNLRHK